MKLAFTLDDLPIWSMSYPPEGHTVAGIVDAIIEALDRNGISGVYAFCNSWALLKHPETAAVMDRWVAAGHHVSNHTHSHIEYNSTGVADYLHDIDLASQHLEPWLSRAPLRLFRHPTCYWGGTEAKMAAARDHLRRNGYRAVEVTTWPYEWRWNRAFLKCRGNGDVDGVAALRREFFDFAVAQARHDALTAARWFGRAITGITVGHTLPFFADNLDALLARMKAEGIEFVPLEEALADPAYDAMASVPTEAFLVYQQKLAQAAGRPIPMIAPAMTAIFDRITDMAKGINA